MGSFCLYVKRVEDLAQGLLRQYNRYSHKSEKQISLKMWENNRKNLFMLHRNIKCF